MNSLFKTNEEKIKYAMIGDKDAIRELGYDPRIEKQPKPMMDDESIKAFKKELLELAVEKNQLDVLEWGAGISTIYFPEFLIKKEIMFRWDSIEHDARWYLKLHDMNKLIQVKLHLFQEPNPADKVAIAKARLIQYINFPRAIWKHYDLIFIDGRRRPECMNMAKRFLKENGIVLLHDAEREAYHEAMGGYKGKFLTKTLWKGIL